jgi:hypothetical protein
MDQAERTREEIDGLLIESWGGFLIEAKFHKEPLNIDPVYRLHVAVHGPN